MLLLLLRSVGARPEVFQQFSPQHMGGPSIMGTHRRKASQQETALSLRGFDLEEGTGAKDQGHGGVRLQCTRCIAVEG